MAEATLPEPDLRIEARQRFKTEEFYYEQRILNSELKRAIWNGRKRLAVARPELAEFEEVKRCYYWDSYGNVYPKLRLQRDIIGKIVVAKENEYSALQKLMQAEERLDELKLEEEHDKLVAKRNALLDSLKAPEIDYRDVMQRFVLRNTNIISAEDSTVPSVEYIEQWLLEQKEHSAEVTREMQLVYQLTLGNLKFLEKFSLDAFVTCEQAIKVHFLSKWSPRTVLAIEMYLNNIYCDLPQGEIEPNLVLFAAICWGWSSDGDHVIHPSI